MAMRRKKAASMLPKPGPNALPIRLRQLQLVERLARKKLKSPLAMRWRSSCQFSLHLEEEHQPMALALVTVLTDQPGQVQVGNREANPQFLVRLAARTDVGRFAFLLMELSTAGTPKSEIRFLRAFQQQHLVCFVKAVKQGGHLIGQRHEHNKDWKEGRHKSQS